MLEKDITAKIIKYLKSLDKCFCFKEHGGTYGSAGIPDIICCYRGHFVALEVKTPKGKTTPLQEFNIKQINRAGGTAVVVRGLEDVKVVLNSLEVGKNE
jgi:Holliday junction resolvase